MFFRIIFKICVILIAKQFTKDYLLFYGIFSYILSYQKLSLGQDHIL